MAETVTQPELILNRYKDETALDVAIKEIHGKVLGEDVPLPAFADLEAKKKAYQAYEKRLGKPPETPKPPAAPMPPGTGPISELAIGAGEDDPDIASILARAGLTEKDVNDQWLANGKLSDAQYAALKGVGYGRKLADTIARGKHADTVLKMQMTASLKSEAANAVGGTEALANLDEFAKSLPKEKLDSYNAMVRAQPSSYPQVMRLIAADHAEALRAGRARPLVTGGAGGTPPSITTWKQVGELGMKAAQGDGEAMRQYMDIHNNKELQAKLK